MTPVRLWPCLLVALGASLPALAADPRHDNIVWNNPVAFTVPGLSHQSFTSTAMGVEMGYSVWLPPGYESSATRYPVLYFLHGAGGNESIDAPAVSQLLAGYLTAKKIPPLICVFLNGGLSGYRDLPAGNVKVETMFTQELLPLIDQKYRTVNDRSSRAICGFSMGGGGAVRLGVRHPERFSAAASWAGALGRRENGQFVPEFDSAPLQPGAPRVRLLFIVGTEDLTYPWHVPTLNALQAAKYPFTYHALDGVGHELGRYYEMTGEEVFTFLTRDFAAPASP